MISFIKTSSSHKNRREGAAHPGRVSGAGLEQVPLPSKRFPVRAWCDAEENVVLGSLCSYDKQMVLVRLSVPLAWQVVEK